MKSRRNKGSKRNKRTRRNRGKTGESPIVAASSQYEKSGSLLKARLSFRKQAMKNARSLFGYTSK